MNLTSPIVETAPRRSSSASEPNAAGRENEMFVTGPRFSTGYQGMRISYGEVIERAQTIAAVAARNTKEAEQLRRLPAENVQAIMDSGLMPLLRPAEFGGFEADWMTQIDCVTEVARICGSTGWCMSFLLQHQFFLALFPEETQRAVYDRHPDPKIATSFSPTGSVREVAGGFELSGRWKFGSGIDHCDWVILGGLVKREGEAPVARNFLLGPGQFEVDRVWNSVGLKGSGSNDILVEPTFVPFDFGYYQADALAGKAPGASFLSGILYRTPLILNSGMAVMTPLHGLARGVYETFIDYTKSRTHRLAGGKATENPDVHRKIGESKFEIDTAYLITEKMSATVFSGMWSHEDRIRQRRDYLMVERLLRSAVDRLFSMAGGSALDEDMPMQRHWRDLHAISSHAIWTPGSIETAGRDAIGLGPAPNDFLVL